MRINPDATTTILDALARTEQTQRTALTQISSGKRINSASDDPIGMSELVDIHSRAVQNDQFTENVSTLKSRLQTADSSLSSVVESLQRAITLGVEGSTGTLSQSNRQALAQEVHGISDSILALANTSFQGAFLFSGTKITAPPFQLDSTSPGGIRYDGNSSVVRTPIAEAQTVEAGVPGDQMFTSANANVFEALQGLQQALLDNDPDEVASATSNVRNSFDHVSAQRVFYGNTAARLERTEDILGMDKVEISQQEDEVSAVDPAEAITQFTQASTARNAVLAAAAKLSSLSLLDYLK